MEWIRVDHPRTRDVFVDGRRSGTTNRVLIVATGTHRFHLGQPVTYAPAKRDVTVTGTSPLVPLAISFAESP